MDAATAHPQPSSSFTRDDQGVWTIHLDRPAATQNALDTRMLHELDAALELIKYDLRAAGVIVRSAKPRGFCAGADLNELRAADTPAQVEVFARLGLRVFNRFRALSIPSTALIHGVCLGGGLELALACRHRIGCLGDADLRIGTPEIRLGLVPGWGAVSLLPRLIGLPAALKLLLTGEPLDGAEAVGIGLLDALIEPGAIPMTPSESSRPAMPWPPANGSAELENAATALPILPGSERARRRILDVLAVDIESGLEAGLEAAARALGESVFSPEGQAALTAFFQKRGPR